MRAWIFLAGSEAWAHALAAWRDGDKPALLAQLVSAYIGNADVRRYAGDPPAEAVELVEQIMLGTAKPDRRRRNASKTSPAKVRRALEQLQVARDRLAEYNANAPAYADARGLEVVGMRSEIADAYHAAVERIAADAGLSVRRLEDLAKPTARTKAV